MTERRAIASDQVEPESGLMVTPTVRLVSPLGSGGMGAVWLAEHTGLQTRVVVKFMHDELGASSSARARFSREAAAAAQVKSPHVVQMLDHGVTEAGAPFIVMEHLEGRNLAAVLRDRGALEPAEVVAIVMQIARALTRVHAAGMLHRDIKPDNVFLCDEGGEVFVKLLDFGIAKAHVEDETTIGTTTNTGQVVGTPFYMSPEQMTAEKGIDERSDVWSLGIVAYECMTGRRPFDGNSFGALVVKIATCSAMPPSQVNTKLPGAVDAWFSRACARKPEERYGSAKELAEALRAAFEGVVVLPDVAHLIDTGSRARIDVSDGREPGAPSRASFALASTVKEDAAIDGALPLARSEPSARALLAPAPPRSSLRIPLMTGALLVLTLVGFWMLSDRPATSIASEDAAVATEPPASNAAALAGNPPPKHGALHAAQGAKASPVEAPARAEADAKDGAGATPASFLPLPVFTANPALDAAADTGPPSVKPVQSAGNDAGPPLVPAVGPAEAGARTPGHDDPL